MSQADNLAALATNVNSSGVLQPAGGGTGGTTFPSPGTAGNVLTSNGTVWTSAANPPAFASGTVMLFVQTSAPTGWTKSTAHDNKALRIVSGTASSGGSVAFTTAFASQGVSGSISNTTATNQATTATNQSYTPTGSVSVSVSGTVGNFTLTTNEIPSHNHISGLGNDGGITGRYGNTGSISSVRLDYEANAFNGSLSTFTSSSGGGAAHNHSFSGSGSGSFSGNAATITQNSHNHTQDAHNHTFTGTAINLAVQYVDVIIATKD
jgi:hypothetical protein